MKKLVNHPSDVVHEMLEGIALQAPNVVILGDENRSSSHSGEPRSGNPLDRKARAIRDAPKSDVGWYFDQGSRQVAPFSTTPRVGRPSPESYEPQRLGRAGVVSLRPGQPCRLRFHASVYGAVSLRLAREFDGCAPRHLAQHHGLP